jgi:thioredoxin reductase (NADPH)
MPAAYDVIIVGAGPAGLTAGLYAGRYGLKTLLLEKMVPGGQILLSERIENFPGFPSGVSTQELIDRMKKQLEELGIAVENDEVVGVVSGSDNAYNVEAQSGAYQAKSIIIASGARPKKLNVKGEDRLIGRGVSYCGTCDGPLFKNKEIAVVGGGNTAIEEALYLTTYASKVHLIHRRQGFRASRIVEEKARHNPKIRFMLDCVIEEINGKARVEGVSIKNVKTNEASTFPCEGVFIFVGIGPNTVFLKNLLNVDESGFIITQPDMSTSRKGVFACGDCIQKSLYQVVNACGEGAQAADSAHKYLLTQVS